MSALQSSCIKAITSVSLSPPFFCSLLVSPFQQHIHCRDVLLAAQLVFSQVCDAGAQSRRQKNQQSPNERSRENISLFAFCFPCPSCSPQEMLPLSFAKDCLYSLILVPSFDKWRPPQKIYIYVYISLFFSDSFKVNVVRAVAC